MQDVPQIEEFGIPGHVELTEFTKFNFDLVQNCARPAQGSPPSLQGSVGGGCVWETLQAAAIIPFFAGFGIGIRIEE